MTAPCRLIFNPALPPRCISRLVVIHTRLLLRNRPPPAGRLQPCWLLWYDHCPRPTGTNSQSS